MDSMVPLQPGTHQNCPDAIAGTDAVAGGCHVAVNATVCSSISAICAGAAYALAQQRRREALLCWRGDMWRALSRLVPVRLHRWRRPGVRRAG